MPNEAIREALGLVQELAVMERPTWAAVSESIPAWHPRNEGDDEGGDDAGASTDKPVTMTQAQLDRVIANRVNQARSQFADYDDLKAKADQLAEIEAANMSATERLTAERDAAKATAEKAAADLSAATLAATRMRVAMETKLPAELMDRLQGDNEDALREDAEQLLAIFKPGSGEETADEAAARKEGQFDAGHRREPGDAGEMTHAEALRLAREEPAKFNDLMDAGKIPAAAMRPSR